MNEQVIAALWQEAHNGFHLAYTREKQLAAKMNRSQPVQVLPDPPKPVKAKKPVKRKKPELLKTEKNKILFDAGRYIQGARDQVAVDAFKVLNSEMRADT